MKQKAILISAFIISFLIISMLYLSPLLEGKRLKQTDISNHIGMSKEIADFRYQTGQEALWTNSMFSGMPAYQISVKYKANIVNYFDKIFTLGLPSPAGYVFLYMLGFFILLLAFGISPLVAFIGAIAFAFSSYFIIIVEAGHNSKAHAIGYMAPVIAGIVLAYKGKIIKGSLITALFLSLQVAANHLQITYYLMIIVAILAITEFVKSIKEKTIKRFSKATLMLLIAAGFSVLTNYTNLMATYEYGKETIRGASELTNNQHDRTSGLDKSYATAWSYGIGESFSLLIPNAKGGATGAIANNKSIIKKIDPQWVEAVGQQNHYWGDQPFTSGPVYAGALVIFLFILGLFTIKNEYKWWLLVATMLSILLSWGKNFMPFTNFFMNYIPGYNKFRAVSMTLVIAEFAIPLLAMMALWGIVKTPDFLAKNKKSLYLSFALTSGVCLIFYLLPQVFFKFLSIEEVNAIAQNTASIDATQKEQFNLFINAIQTTRIAIFKADVIRSLLFIIVGCIPIMLFVNKKINKTILLLSVAIVIAIDMISIDKRYLNNSNFVSKSNVTNPFNMTNADSQILADKNLSYRVLNLTVSTFNDASTSYFHKSIGGYHGAKLRRYQELIDHHISKNNMNVINMLNTKYFITFNNEKQVIAQQNIGALGNAWFVNDIKWVKNADEEIENLNNFDPKHQAIIDEKYKSIFKNFTSCNDSLSTIKLVDYKPNNLVYKFNSKCDQLVVFSEIFYNKGWLSYIDGKETPHGRVNYVLRSMIVPAGEHTIDFTFKPSVFYNGEKVSFASSLILIILLAAGLAYEIKKYYVKTKKTM